jgi:cell division protein FtsQ
VDGPADVSSPLRLVSPEASSKKGFKLGKRKSQGPLPPGVERRRRLRQERRQERLIQLWRLVFFLLTATGLSWLLLTLGWSLRSASQIQISGSQRMDETVVVNAAGLSFPQSLLSLEPGEIETKLMQELPVQEVSVQRRLLPPGLNIQLVERRPVAAATRMGPKGIERGMVDREAQWMPMDMAKQGEKPASAVKIEGWISSRRAVIARILQEQDRLGRPLKTIVVEPAGGINLRIETLGLVYLGANDALLDQQFKTIAQLNQSLPPGLRGSTSEGLDLSDPGQPELKLRPAPNPSTQEKVSDR